MEYEVYTDGACSGNPGKGGYAFVVISKNTPLIVSGKRENTTNNHMELMAIVRAVKYIAKIAPKIKFTITIYSDSAYCINSITQGWIKSWELNEWKTKAGTIVKNQELWEKYLCLTRKYTNMKVNFVKVKGHSGNKYNELVDRAAKAALRT